MEPWQIDVSCWSPQSRVFCYSGLSWLRQMASHGRLRPTRAPCRRDGVQGWDGKNTRWASGGAEKQSENSELCQRETSCSPGQRLDNLNIKKDKNWLYLWLLLLEKWSRCAFPYASTKHSWHPRASHWRRRRLKGRSRLGSSGREEQHSKVFLRFSACCMRPGLEKPAPWKHWHRQSPQGPGKGQSGQTECVYPWRLCFSHAHRVQPLFQLPQRPGSHRAVRRWYPHSPLALCQRRPTKRDS